MRLIELKNLIIGTYLKAPVGTPAGTPLLRVPRGTAFDPETMTQAMFSYRDTIESILSSPSDPRVGVKAVEVRRAVKILGELDEVSEGKPWVLEDEPWSYLDGRVQDTDWRTMIPAVVTFCDDIHHAPAISKERLAKMLAPEDAPADTRKTERAKLRVPAEATPAGVNGSG